MGHVTGSATPTPVNLRHVRVMLAISACASVIVAFGSAFRAVQLFWRGHALLEGAALMALAFVAAPKALFEGRVLFHLRGISSIPTLRNAKTLSRFAGVWMVFSWFVVALLLAHLAVFALLCGAALVTVFMLVGNIMGIVSHATMRNWSEVTDIIFKPHVMEKKLLLQLADSPAALFVLALIGCAIFLSPTFVALWLYRHESLVSKQAAKVGYGVLE